MFLRATILIVLCALAVVTSAATGKGSGNATQDTFSWPPDDAVFSTNLDVDWDSVGVAVKDTPEYETSKWKEPEQETLRTIVIPSDAAPGTFASINDKATGDLIVALRVCAGDAKNVSASDGGNATARSGGAGDGEVSPLFNSSVSPFPLARGREQYCVPAGSHVLLAETPSEICLMGLLEGDMEAELFANSISQARLDPESEKVTGSGKRRSLTLSRRLRRRSSKRRKMCKAGKGKAEKNTPATRTKKPQCCSACLVWSGWVDPPQQVCVEHGPPTCCGPCCIPGE